MKRETKVKVVVGALSGMLLATPFLKNRNIHVVEPTQSMSSHEIAYEDSRVLWKQEDEETHLISYESYLSSILEQNLEEYLSLNDSNSFQEMNQEGITMTSVNLRYGPSTDYDIIEELKDDRPLDVLGVCDNGWYLVKTSDTIGFICGDYIRVLYPELVDAQTIEEPTVLRAVQATTDVNIRDGSNSVDATIIGSLKEGEVIQAFKRLDNGWYEVEYNGRIAYVSGDYVKEIFATSTEQNFMIYVEENVPFYYEPYTQMVKEVDESAIFRVYGENDDYYYIDYHGEFGYIKKKHAEKLTDTYVVVDISDQTLSIYQGGEKVLTTSVVTGKDSTPTDLGFFQINSKSMNQVLRGADYATHVDYWMPYNGGEGLHDASWRSSFGGEIYHASGSHGCVNMPSSITEDVYNLVHVGDKVLVKE